MQKQILTVMDNLFDPNGIGISNGNYFGLPYRAMMHASFCCQCPGM